MITTHDVISDTLTISQHRPGFRFGLDALILATDLWWLTPESCVWELGAAQGAVALSVASRRPDVRVVAVERQEALHALLEHNIAQNPGLADRVQTICADLRALQPSAHAHTADTVLCNPPYFRVGARRVSPNEERACAHHELHGGVEDFLRVARYLLRPRGWFKMIIPPLRLADVYACLQGTDLALVSLRFVHARRGEDAYLVEVVARRGGAPDVRVPSPLWVRDADGAFTEEMARRIAGAARPEQTGASCDESS